MGFFEFVRDFFGPAQQTVYLTQNVLATAETQLAIEELAVVSAINLIASAVSKCEFRTYIDGKEVKADEYYLWNIEPNANQNSSQFEQELISKVLYYGDGLVVGINGQMIIADSFVHDEYATREDVFRSVTRGTMNFSQSFRMSDVLYFKLGNVNVRALLAKTLTGYNNLLTTSIGKHKRSGGRKGILDINATASGNKDFKTKFADLMNNRFKSYFEAENAVLPLENGYTYSEQPPAAKGTTSEIVDIAAITKEAFDRVAQAYKIPPALMRGDVADVGQHVDNLLTFCVDPLTDMMAEEINRKRFGKKGFLAGSFIDIDTTTIKHIDIFAVAVQADKLIACGLYDIDELRRKLGDAELNTDWSKKHMMTKNYSPVDGVLNALNEAGGPNG